MKKIIVNEERMRVFLDPDIVSEFKMNFKVKKEKIMSKNYEVGQD